MDMTLFAPVRFEEGKLLILDQTRLPGELSYIEMKKKKDVWEAIRRLQVRGAPAIGIAAAYGAYVCMKENTALSYKEFYAHFLEVKEYLNGARPTAVNLSWALTRMERILQKNKEEPLEFIKEQMLLEAEAIRMEDERACRSIGDYGLSLLKPGMGILTHCNAGVLATSQYGTALAPIYVGQEKGYGFKVFADETRPLLQGARLTAWELVQAGVDVTLICDNMASMVMKNGWVQAVFVGCDRMAANGDGANKIGTSGVAVLAKEYGIPFYMCVPTSTIDLDTPDGAAICIEERNGDEIAEMWYAQRMAPKGVKLYNPAFDVTAAKYITAVVTEKGIARPPYAQSLRKLMGGSL